MTRPAAARTGRGRVLITLLGLIGLLSPITGPAAAGPPPAARRHPPPDSPLPAAVADALAQAQVPGDAFAAVLLPVHGPARPAWGVRADKPMPPASTMKLVTSIVALDRLGANYRVYTELLSAAPQQGDVLAGDLVLRGGGDPELWLAQAWALLAELRWLGIREIAGDIVLDRTLFRPAPGDAGGNANAAPFDERPEFHYNQVPDALQLNGNLLGLEISSEAGRPAAISGDAGRPAAVGARAVPPLPGVEIDAGAMRLTDHACRDWGDAWQSPPLLTEPEPGRLRITLRGGFPRGCTQRTALALIDRLPLAERHLRWLWSGLGGQWRGQLRDLRAADSAPPKPALRLLARRASRPWGELLRVINKQSDNPSSRLLYLSLGVGSAQALASAGQAGDASLPSNVPTTELAARAVRAWLAEHKIPATGLVLDNGSGLSRSERITPRQLALMLKAAHGARWAPELLASLPVAGVDGTMRNRLKTSAAAGNARLKTGTMKNAVALAGYVPDEQGRLWVLAAMVEHDQAITARPALDALVDWVASGGLPVGAATPARPVSPGHGRRH